MKSYLVKLFLPNGGFEYVDKDYRMELGEYVLYSADDGRVSGHLNQFKDIKEDEGSED
jgi:hypothetical protein